MAVRVVTWNLNRATWQSRKNFRTAVGHAHAAWTELGALKVDVALLQEAMPPPLDLASAPDATIPEGSDREDWRSLPGPARWWCSAIAAWGPGLRPLPEEGRVEPLWVSQKGAYAVGLVEGRSKPIIVASVYALWDYGWLPSGSKPKYAHTSLHRAVSDLTPVLDTASHGMSVVLAGDFNTSSQFPSPHREAFRTVHDRLAGLGLHNVAIRPDGEDLAGCPCDDDPCRHVRSYEGAIPYQDDYVYVSADLARGAKLVGFDQSEPAKAVSDHLPLVVDLPT
jgi:hypothetical protein